MSMRTSAIKKWWRSKSKLFTTMCATELGESFTNGEVVLVHLFIVVFLFVLSIIGLWEGGMI